MKQSHPSRGQKGSKQSVLKQTEPEFLHRLLALVGVGFTKAYRAQTFETPRDRSDRGSTEMIHKKKTSLLLQTMFTAFTETLQQHQVVLWEVGRVRGWRCGCVCVCV